MNADDVQHLVQEITQSLQQRRALQGATSEHLTERITRLLSDMDDAAQLLPSANEGFLHLPGETMPEGSAELSQQVREASRQERDELRANLLALQQERDVLRGRIRELETSLQEARAALERSASRVPAVSVTESAGPASESVQFEAHDPSGHKRRMGDILIEAEIITQEQLDALLAEQTGGKHKRLGALLVEKGITSEVMIAKVLAAQLKLPYVDLSAFEIVEAAALQITGELARRHECIPIDGDLSGITLAMGNPLDLLAIENVELTSKRRVVPVVAIPSAIEAAITRIYSKPN